MVTARPRDKTPEGSLERSDDVSHEAAECDVSVVLPCLNEEGTVAACVEKARQWFARSGLRGEVIVVDNGSTDRSRDEALRAGARVIDEPRRGYGAAHMRGFAEARGKYIVMADADDTYDLRDLDPKAMKATFVRAPVLADVPFPVQMEPNLVVEFYSR